MSTSRTEFVEQAGLVFEREGMPRMAGRVLGHLMVCTPAEQSIAQLMHALGASNGSISTTTRFLESQGYVQRVVVHGDRKDYFALPDDVAAALLTAALRGIQAFHELFDRALALDAKSQRAAVRDARDLFDEIADAYRKMLKKRAHAPRAREARSSP